MGRKCATCVELLTFIADSVAMLRSLSSGPRRFDPSLVKRLAEWTLNATVRRLEEEGCADPRDVESLKGHLGDVVRAAEAEDVESAYQAARAAGEYVLFVARSVAETCQGE